MTLVRQYLPAMEMLANQAPRAAHIAIRTAQSYAPRYSLAKQKNIQTGAELVAALNGYSVAFAYHSGNIENSHVTI